MKLLDVSRDQKYLYIHTEDGTRKESLPERTSMGSDNAALVSVSRGENFLLDKDSRLLYVALTRAKKRLFIAKR